MNHLKSISKTISFSFLMMLLICSCGSDGEKTQTTTPTASIAPAALSDTAPKAVEASLAVEEKVKPVEEVETPEPVKEEAKVVKKETPKKKKKERKPRAKMVFDQQTHDYGFIMQGDKVKHDFNFRNVGDGDLLITRVKPSCGCTTPDYPKEVIPPGGSGKVSVVFDSKGKLGRQIPKIDVYTNYERRLTVKLEGYVDTERAKPPSVIKKKVEEVEKAVEDAPNVEADTSSVGGM